MHRFLSALHDFVTIFGVKADGFTTFDVIIDTITIFDVNQDKFLIFGTKVANVMTNRTKWVILQEIDDKCSNLFENEVLEEPFGRIVPEIGEGALWDACKFLGDQVGQLL